MNTLFPPVRGPAGFAARATECTPGTTGTGRAARNEGGFLLGRLMTRFARWRIYRETLSALRALDDHTLYDIGISRAEIASVARDTAVCDELEDTAPATDRSSPGNGTGNHHGESGKIPGQLAA